MREGAMHDDAVLIYDTSVARAASNSQLRLRKLSVDYFESVSQRIYD